jgi:hypothetical protein
LYRESRRRQACGYGFGRGQVDIRNRNRRACSREPARNAFADPCGRAGDNGGLAG